MFDEEKYMELAADIQQDYVPEPEEGLELEEKQQFVEQYCKNLF